MTTCPRSYAAVTPAGNRIIAACERPTGHDGVCNAPSVYAPDSPVSADSNSVRHHWRGPTSSKEEDMFIKATDAMVRVDRIEAYWLTVGGDRPAVHVRTAGGLALTYQGTLEDFEAELIRASRINFNAEIPVDKRAAAMVVQKGEKFAADRS